VALRLRKGPYPTWKWKLVDDVQIDHRRERGRWGAWEGSSRPVRRRWAVPCRIRLRYNYRWWWCQSQDMQVFWRQPVTPLVMVRRRRRGRRERGLAREGYHSRGWVVGKRGGCYLRDTSAFPLIWRLLAHLTAVPKLEYIRQQILSRSHHKWIILDNRDKLWGARTERQICFSLSLDFFSR